MLDDAQIQYLKNCASRRSFYVPPLQYEQTVFWKHKDAKRLNETFSWDKCINFSYMMQYT